MKLIHFGCSFAMGNGVPEYVEGLKSGAFVHLSKNRKDFSEKYNLEPVVPVSCGMVIARQLKIKSEKVADNGISNEMIFRRLLLTDLKDAFVLIGLTSANRREALTTDNANRHWQTWKMVGPTDAKKFKDLPFDPWGKDYTVAIEHDAQTRTVIQILYMQQYLKSLGVPYLMFNALWNGFDIPLTSECDQLLKKVDQKHFFKLYATAEETQHGWCKKRKLNVSDLDDHPNIKGQEAWAEELLPHVKDILNAD
jgi:hypothetical protein